MLDANHTYHFHPISDSVLNDKSFVKKTIKLKDQGLVNFNGKTCISADDEKSSLVLEIFGDCGSSDSRKQLVQLENGMIVRLNGKVYEVHTQEAMDLEERLLISHGNRLAAIMRRPIDTGALKEYLERSRKISPFEWREFTDLFPGGVSELNNILEFPELYDGFMDMAALAIKEYNKEHSNNFKVVGIEILNKVWGDGYYITFTALESSGKKPKKSVLSFVFNTVRCALMVMLTYLIWMSSLLGFMTNEITKSLMCAESKLSVQDFKASTHECHNKTAVRKTFRAKVVHLTDMPPDILFCYVHPSGGSREGDPIIAVDNICGKCESKFPK